MSATPLSVYTIPLPSTITSLQSRKTESSSHFCCKMASQSDPNAFSMRIVSIDYYMAPPIPDVDICYSSFQGGDVAEVPVIRIYGSTLSRQKTCLHVHRALPYLYVPCSDVLRTPQEGYAYTQLVSHAMEKALKLKSSAGSKRQHVHGCSLVRARRFYGYHPTEELFVKIYLYHPHEVARAATMLLGGAILNRSFQPYESHFPYLLQFLVDYNLYGMGLIHVSKVKFRRPVPVNLIPRAVRHSNMYSRQHRHHTDKFPFESGNFQADSISETCQDPPVWLSSTIPSSWMWPSATGNDCSPNQGMHLIVRQSTCELEGDTSVDDILNQKCKMYTSLSQARTDVKMVQSLVPIWEEEYERTGVHEIVTSLDSSKPPPENVLRTFSREIDLETALLDLCMEARNSLSSQFNLIEDEILVTSIRSVSDLSDSHALEEYVDSRNPLGESMKCPEEENKIGSSAQGLLYEEGADAKPSDQMGGLSPVVEEMLFTEMAETSNPKVADIEALGLLRWLASSKAVEDLSTDDELVHEAILSPLLHSSTIEKVLEKAHLDYESESQQECRDILGSIEGTELAPNSDCHGHSVGVSSENTIPQVDGSFDDPFTTSQVGYSSEAEMNKEVTRSSLHLRLEDLGTGRGKRKRKKQFWGSLPFSRKQLVLEDSDSSRNSNESCSDEVRSGADASSGNDEDTRNGALVINMETDCSGLKEGKILTGCSVRDLMRINRCSRFDPSEHGSHKIKKVVSEKVQSKETFSNSVHHPLQNVVHPILSGETAHAKSFLNDHTDHGLAVQEGYSGATSISGAVSECSRPKPAYNSFSRYGKLPFPPCPVKTSLVDAFSNEHFGFNDNSSDKGRIGASAPSEGFAAKYLSQLADGSEEVPECFNSDQRGPLKHSSIGECYELKVESDLRSSKILKPDACSGEPDFLLTASLLKFDEHGPAGKGLEQVHSVPLTSLNIPAERPSKDDYTGNRGKEANVATKGVLDMPYREHKELNDAVGANKLHVESYMNKEVDMKIFSSGSERTLSTDVSTRENQMEYIEMRFRRPPIVDRTDWNSDAVLAPSVQNSDFVFDLDNCDKACDYNLQCLKGRDSDYFPPFFASNYQEGKETPNIEKFHESFRSRETPNIGNILGIPIHYQNDGSILYLLTPALSPPSLECVRQWLLQLEYQNTANISTGTSRENVYEVLMEPASPKYDSGLRVVNDENDCSNQGRSSSDLQKTRAISSCDLLNPHGSLGDTSYSTRPESNSLPNIHLELDQLSQDNHGKPEAEINACYTDRTATKSECNGNQVKEKGCSRNWQEISQISGPDTKSKLTPLSQTGFRDSASIGAGQQLTLLSIEVMAESRADLCSDPHFDAINIIALAFQEDSSHSFEVYVLLRGNDKESCQRNLDGVSGCKVVVTSDEKLLLDHFVKIICLHDPDILMGWEIQGGSLGFLAERAGHLGVSLLKTISRTPTFETKIPASDLGDHEKGNAENLLPDAITVDPVVLEDSIIEDEWGRTHASGVHVGGRIVLNIWRIMRSEIKLNMYTVEAVAEAVLRRKIPSIPCKTLTKWFSSGPGRARFRCIEHVIERVKLNLEIMNQLDMINRTSELARVFGIDFFSVLSRGSQYRVESMFLRLAHTQNYLAISPGNQQVASQPAMECLPLVMEPESGFYADPVVVLDFQSLYPSMIIAYNLCFCTCLGNIRPSKANTLGVSSFSPDPQIFMDLKDQILLTPNGVMYVPRKIRKGVLPHLLEEILSTRVMVKKAMKKFALSRVLHRIFNARQLALKLIANVTYGYTAAGFSGRMPCAELADSIVQCGRKTLETAISFVNTHENWKAKVIYGDTDSMFVLLKGRTLEQAFQIGQEIASAITAMNPNPVALKMEKVYLPCVLLTKKRYVGYSYESPDQSKPTFDAKGIETVRRDTCAAVAKTLEQSLRILFEHQDISIVKEYLHRQWTRILSGKVSIQDFVFAKEVRLGTYRSSSLPPAALVATKAMRADPRAEPRYGERVPYVVIHGEPGARLVDMVVDPLDLLDINSPYRLNDLYYINKQIIPALQRVFRLLGADLNQWFTETPRPVRPTLAKRHLYASNLESADDNNKHVISRKAPANKTRIDYYYLSKHCTLCGELVQGSDNLCDKCTKKGPAVAAAVIGRTSKLERNIQHLCAICRHCGGGDWIVERGVKCTSLACSVFYERRKVQKELQSLCAISTDAGFYPKCTAEWF